MDFSLRSKPLRGGTRKIRTAQAVAMPQGAARGRPERATDPQEAWRKTRNKLSGRGSHLHFMAARGNEWRSAAGITFRCIATRACGQRAKRDGGMLCAEGFGRREATGSTASRRSMRHSRDVGESNHVAGPARAPFPAERQGTCPPAKFATKVAKFESKVVKFAPKRERGEAELDGRTAYWKLGDAQWWCRPVMCRMANSRTSTAA